MHFAINFAFCNAFCYLFLDFFVSCTFRELWQNWEHMEKYWILKYILERKETL